MPSWWAPARPKRRKAKPRKRATAMAPVPLPISGAPPQADTTLVTTGRRFAHVPKPLALGLPAEFGAFHYRGQAGFSCKNFVTRYSSGLSRLFDAVNRDHPVVAAYLAHFGLNGGLVPVSHVQTLVRLMHTVGRSGR